MLKPFDMEPGKAIPKKPFVSEEKNNCEKEVNLTTPQNSIGHIDLCKCGCECKLMAAFAESFSLLLHLKSKTARRASHHSAFIGNCPTISHACSLIYLVDELFLFVPGVAEQIENDG